MYKPRALNKTKTKGAEFVFTCATKDELKFLKAMFNSAQFILRVRARGPRHTGNPYTLMKDAVWYRVYIYRKHVRWIPHQI